MFCGGVASTWRFHHVSSRPAPRKDSWLFWSTPRKNCNAVTSFWPCPRIGPIALTSFAPSCSSASPFCHRVISWCRPTPTISSWPAVSSEIEKEREEERRRRGRSVAQLTFLGPVFILGKKIHHHHHLVALTPFLFLSRLLCLFRCARACILLFFCFLFHYPSEKWFFPHPPFLLINNNRPDFIYNFFSPQVSCRSLTCSKIQKKNFKIAPKNYKKRN